jgi:hypothetical protein
MKLNKKVVTQAALKSRPGTKAGEAFVTVY